MPYSIVVITTLENIYEFQVESFKEACHALDYIIFMVETILLTVNEFIDSVSLYKRLVSGGYTLWKDDETGMVDFREWYEYKQEVLE